MITITQTYVVLFLIACLTCKQSDKQSVGQVETTPLAINSNKYNFMFWILQQYMLHTTFLEILGSLRKM